MLMKKLISVTLFFFYAYTGLVWAQENKHIIKINNHKFIQIEPYTDRIIRIRVSDHKDFPETLMERYGIIKTDWNKTEFSAENKDDKK